MQATELAQFTGTTQYYRHRLGPFELLLTEGCKYVAEAGKSYWLFDLILSYQLYKVIKNQYVQVWKLQKQENGSWLASCEDGNGNPLAKQKIPYADFPLDRIKILVKQGVCLLPSED